MTGCAPAAWISVRTGPSTDPAQSCSTGRRLFEDLPPDHIELELLRALDGPGVLHLRYRVRSEG
jgi:hypothetical protein